MAVIQRPYPYALPRPAARPVVRARARPVHRSAPRSMLWPVVLAAATAVVLSIVVAGHAQMTAANFDRVVLRGEQAAVLRSNQVLRSSIIALTDKDHVDRWAQQNYMVRSDSTQMIQVSRPGSEEEAAQWPSESTTPTR